MFKYIVLITGLLIAAQANFLLAEEKKEIVPAKESQIEETIAALDSLTEFEELFKAYEISIKDAKKYINDNKNTFKTLQLEEIANLNEKTLEKAQNALAKLITGIFKTSINVRKVLLKSETSELFFKEIHISNFGPKNSLTQYQNIDKEAFQKAKSELVKKLKWSIEITEEGEVKCNDELTGIKFSIDSEGNIQGSGGQKDGGKIQITSVRLGMAVKELDDEDKKKSNVDSGVTIITVKKGSSAEKSELQKGDIITHLNDKPIDKKTDLDDILKNNKEKTVSFKIKRGNETLNIKVAMPTGKGPKMDNRKFHGMKGEMPPMQEAPLAKYLGIAVEELDDEEKKECNVDAGIIITKVEEKSFAEEAGLKEEDIITHLNGEIIDTKAFLQEALKSDREKPYNFKVKRGDKTLDIEVKVKAAPTEQK